jgi:membrane associated rhomboid family serine protease
MIPLRDDNPTRTTPVVTITLIVLNAVVFLFQLLYGLEASAQHFGLIPAELMHHVDKLYVMRDAAGVEIFATRNVEPAWVTVFASMFMHGGWMHVIGNMWFLWIFGNNVEDQMGKARFVFFYLLCGMGAAAAQVFLEPNSTLPMVGASGAIAGVLGAYLVLFPGSRVLCATYMFVLTTFELPAWVVLGIWFVIQFFSGLGALGSKTGGVAYAAHVGGFALGWLLVRLFAVPPGRPRRDVSGPGSMDWR